MGRSDGLAFEYYCAELLKDNGFEKVRVTSGSGDQGVDITAKKDGIKYAIQCKYYSSKVGNTPVQEVYAGKVYYGCDKAIVMTNSMFTKSAIDLAKATDVILWDGNVIDKLKHSSSVSGSALNLSSNRMVKIMLALAIIASLIIGAVSCSISENEKDKGPITLDMLQAADHPMLHDSHEDVSDYYYYYHNVLVQSASKYDDDDCILALYTGYSDLSEIDFYFGSLTNEEQEQLDLNKVLEIVIDYIPKDIVQYYDRLLSVQFDYLSGSKGYVCYYKINENGKQAILESTLPANNANYIAISVVEVDGKFSANLSGYWNGYDEYFQRYDPDFLERVSNLREWGWYPF